MFLSLGHAIHKTVWRYAPRDPSGATWFLRNVPLLAAIAEQIHLIRPTGEVRIWEIGCSTGIKVYSVLWMVRKRFPQILLSMLAMDFAPAAVAFAQAGKYNVNSEVFRGAIDEATKQEMFDREGDTLVVKPWLREGVQWHVALATDPKIAARFGKQDVVLANNFMVHMSDNDAANCMSNLVRLVRPSGLLVCRGVHLDIREKAVERVGLCPLTSYIEEIHDADRDLDAAKIGRGAIGVSNRSISPEKTGRSATLRCSRRRPPQVSQLSYGRARLQPCREYMFQGEVPAPTESGTPEVAQVAASVYERSTTQQRSIQQ